MNDLILAQLDLDGWIQGIVVLLVIGGSIFAPLAKKLIDKFSPQESDDPGKPGEIPDAARPAPPRRARPAHPVARPLPSAPQPVTGRPIERQRVPGDIPQPEAPPRRTADRPSVPPPPLPTAAPARPIQRVKPVPRPQRREPVHDLVEEHLGHLEPHLGKRLGHLESAVEEEEKGFDSSTGQRGGHVDSELDVPDVAAAWRVSVTALQRPTRRALRHAIVMKEILGPPIALRSADDRL